MQDLTKDDSCRAVRMHRHRELLNYSLFDIGKRPNYDN